MKKALTLTNVLIALAIITAVATASVTGYLYGHGLYIETVPGTTVASISNAGVATVTGVVNSGTLTAAGITNTGALANTGAVSNTGTLSNIGAVTVATASTSGYYIGLNGAVVTLATHTITEGQVFYQTSDHKLYVATKTVTSNDPSCVGTGCYAALN